MSPERPFSSLLPEASLPSSQLDISFGLEGFDINAAFQEALTGVVNSSELALEEKIRRMEILVAEGTSEEYRDFVNFKALAAQLEIACSHDHNLGPSLNSNLTLLSFMNSQKNDEHDHDSAFDDHHDHEPVHHGEDEEDDDEDGNSPKTKKKKRKQTRRRWFGIFFD